MARSESNESGDLHHSISLHSKFKIQIKNMMMDLRLMRERPKAPTINNLEIFFSSDDRALIPPRFKRPIDRLLPMDKLTTYTTWGSSTTFISTGGLHHFPSTYDIFHKNSTSSVEIEGFQSLVVYCLKTGLAASQVGKTAWGFCLCGLCGQRWRLVSSACVQ
ncbi:hypothetical protein KSP39_PZI011447 [Platanthera zijinensis]|uniref:Uncharacterized protein n=1 Tax=Platanthera zijinensis TaxID=2320716 RepID=A0AAP0BGQ1_9ASPA